MTGITTPQTLKIEGYIKKKKVILLIDSGSTHNFIHSKIEKDLNCFIYPAPEFQVMVADGETIKCSGKCHNIKLSMGEYVLNSPMISIPMGGDDVVLGCFNDFITCLPKSEGKSVIMVVFDRLTKYAHFCALSHPFNASTVATAFTETVQKLHGTPKIIVSDRDPIFTRNFWTELFSCLGTQLAHSSSYHPQYDGKTEIVNKCLEGYLRCFVSDKQTQWVKWLTLAEWWYNTSFHMIAKMNPFMALYGYHPPSITSSLRYQSKVQEVEENIENQQQVLQLLKDNLTLT